MKNVYAVGVICGLAVVVYAVAFSANAHLAVRLVLSMAGGFPAGVFFSLWRREMS